jgi:hypothetical protein
MIRNPIYRGELVWNRSEWIKDAEGARKRHERPESEWVRQDRPDLAIVDAPLWDAAGAERKRRAAPYRRTRDGRHFAPGNGNARHTRTRHVLSGLLECAACGGGFHALNAAARYGCGWHRDRGPAVCDVRMTVPRVALEERIFGAIRDRILVPEHVLYVVERALGLVREGLDREAHRSPLSASARARLEEIDEELATLRRVAERTGHAERVADLLAELLAERAALTAQAPRAPLDLDVETLRPLVEARVRDLRGAFEAEPEHGRAALRALLAGRRMRVGADAELGFRVEGVFEIDLGGETPGATYGGPGSLAAQVAGVCTV